MAQSSFKIDPNNYLSLDHSSYKNELYSIAISTPKVYFDLRTSANQSVKKEAISKMYQTLYNILSSGTAYDGTTPVLEVNGRGLKPCYPDQLISSFCLSACKSLEEICDEAIDIILPIDFNTIMSKKLIQSGNTENPQNI